MPELRPESLEKIVAAAKSHHDGMSLWPRGTIARARQDLMLAELRYALEEAGVEVKKRL